MSWSLSCISVFKCFDFNFYLNSKILPCISYFFQCYEQTPDTNNLKNEGFFFLVVLRDDTIHYGGVAIVTGTRGGGHIAPVVRKQREGRKWAEL